MHTRYKYLPEKKIEITMYHTISLTESRKNETDI